MILVALLACADPRADMVHIPDASVGGPGGYWIDRYEFPNRAGAAPRTYTDLADAREGCASVGKRVCTAAEWRRACLGAGGSSRYGYGPAHRSGTCHDERALPSGHTSMMDVGALVAPSGSYAACVTGEGVHDLVGNVEEWVLDDWHGVDGMLEGGAFYTWSGFADCRGDYSRAPDYRLDPGAAVYSAGFRCCWSEEAPDEAHLDAARVRADADARMRAAREAVSGAAYDPDAEVEVRAGLYMDVYEYPNRPGENARVAVTWAEADGLCAAAGKRLCSVNEWEQACAGEADRRFPYGDAYEEGACSVALGLRRPAGRAPSCVTVEGVHDLVGGVQEWTSDAFDARGVLPGPAVARREVRGGSAWSDPSKSVCRPDDGYPAAPEDAAFPDLGFRCCRGQGVEMLPRPVLAACPDGMSAVGTGGRAVCVDRLERVDGSGQPDGGLTLADAEAACGADGKRICTTAEWMAACTGQGARRWPYGDAYVPGRCVDGGGGARIGGSAVECVTPEGLVDMSGNLWEWTRGATGGELHGGGWSFSAGFGQCRSVAHADARHADPQFGVRCCAEPLSAR